MSVLKLLDGTKAYVHAVIDSQPGADISGKAPMPSWDWGVVKGPYLG